MAHIITNAEPCDQCGGKPVVRYYHSDDTYSIFCVNPNCALYLAEFDDYQDEESAINFWNDVMTKTTKNVQGE